MIKKVTVALLIVVFAFAGVACSSDDDNVTVQETTPAVAEETTVAPTESVAEAEDIGEAKVKAIVLNKVPGATEGDITSFEREIEHGRVEYEGELYYDGIEYEFEISGADGSILDWEVDRY